MPPTYFRSENEIGINSENNREIKMPTKVYYHFWINEEDPKIAKICPNPEWKHPLGGFPIKIKTEIRYHI